MCDKIESWRRLVMFTAAAFLYVDGASHFQHHEQIAAWTALSMATWCLACAAVKVRW